jgi:cytosine/adenosine deaminase-related metal-dependent hydrolase
MEWLAGRSNPQVLDPTAVCRRRLLLVAVLLRGCGCVRAWVRVCLSTASRAAQAAGCRDAPCAMCLSVCALV